MMEIIVHELPGAPDDPVELLAALRTGPFAFLLESAAGSGARARYTFLGSAPKEAWRYTGRRVEQWLPATGWLMAADTADPIGHIGARMRERPMAGTEALPPFAGGAVGFLGYDVVETLERLPASHPDDLGVPDALFLVADSVIVIDKLEKRTMVVASVEVPETACREERDGLLEDARRRIAAIEARTTGVAALPPLPPASSEVPAAMSRTSGDDFMAGVRAIKGHIAAGDVFQCVLSRRIEVSRRVEPLTLYRSMRELNPAPYLYYLELDGFAIVGGSPEMLVHVEDREVTVRPIAGTRPRGANPPEDASLAAALLADPKERAEHAMLVDLGRNDVGRVAKYGTVRVAESMVLERYTHVQHIVSEVRGELAAGKDAVDALKACFPAGTVTGAPKVRAMELLDALEPVRRGPYAGAVGYIGWGARNVDTAITIRTCVVLEDRVLVQAGAGIVADSDPAAELAETQHKARGALRAIAAVRGAP